MAQQKKQGKRSYLNDFQKTADGSYVYTGDTWQADPARRKKGLIRLWALAVPLLAASVVPGCLEAPGLGNCAYVLLPYVFGLVSALYLAYVLIRLCAGGDPMRDYVYLQTVARMDGYAALPMVGGILSAVGLTVYLIRNGAGGQAPEAAACYACFALQAGLSWAIRACRISSIWTKNA